MTDCKALNDGEMKSKAIYCGYNQVCKIWMIEVNMNIYIYNQPKSQNEDKYASAGI